MALLRGNATVTDYQATRRRMLTAAAAGGLVAAAALGTARAQSARKTFVLIPGAFCGAWCWHRVSDRLEKQGHKGYSLTLTGLGTALTF